MRVIKVEVDDVHCSLSEVDGGTNDQTEGDPNQLVGGAASLGERAEVGIAWLGVWWPDKRGRSCGQVTNEVLYLV